MRTFRLTKKKLNTEYIFFSYYGLKNIELMEWRSQWGLFYFSAAPGIYTIWFYHSFAVEQVRERWKVSNWEDPAGFTLRMFFNFSDMDNNFGPDALGMIVPVKRSLWLMQLKINRALFFGRFNV